jgi:hypothetical protein
MELALVHAAGGILSGPHGGDGACVGWRTWQILAKLHSQDPKSHLQISHLSKEIVVGSLQDVSSLLIHGHRVGQLRACMG